MKRRWRQEGRGGGSYSEEVEERGERGLYKEGEKEVEGRRDGDNRQSKEGRSKKERNRRKREERK